MLESLPLMRRRSAMRPEPSTVLREFFDEALDAAALGLGALHHVAFYLGDYRSEDEVEDWWNALVGAPGVSDAARGPSHIAPRAYGTPGWWFSCRLDGHPVEFFTCRSYGAWADRRPEHKMSLMSHYALEVGRADRVEPLLLALAERPGIERLAFSDDDPLGHTYGHLLDTKRHRVLELVHDPRTSPSRSRYRVTPDCIACDTCLCIAPKLFGRKGALAEVLRQPDSESDCELMEEARSCCPVGAIVRLRSGKGA